MTRQSRKEPSVELLDAMKGPVPVDQREGAETRKLAATLRVQGAFRRERHRRSRIRSWFAAAAAAAVVLVVGAGAGLAYRGRLAAVAANSSSAAPHADSSLLVHRGNVVARRASAERPVPVGASVPVLPGDELIAASGAAATLTLPRDVHVELGEKTEAQVELAGIDEERLRLALGSTAVSVPKPGGPKTFSVVTPDARVVVHGTIFQVIVEEDPVSHRLRTRVSVTRGSVFVESAAGTRLLQAGESWSSRPPDEPVIESAPAGSAEPPESASPSTSARPRSAAPIRHETLRAQNTLFQAALDARNAGNQAAVVSSLTELLRRYPETPLAQEAELALFRALKRLHRDREAGIEARRYLSTQPDSASRDEARRTLLESPAAPDK